jgi:hypothetical protein
VLVKHPKIYEDTTGHDPQKRLALYGPIVKSLKPLL